jgi:hypothetical protein
MAKCPKCEKLLGAPIGQKSTIYINGEQLPGITYICNFCQTIIGVQVDPVILKREIVQEVITAVEDAIEDKMKP